MARCFPESMPAPPKLRLGTLLFGLAALVTISLGQPRALAAPAGSARGSEPAPTASEKGLPISPEPAADLGALLALMEEPMRKNFVENMVVQMRDAGVSGTGVEVVRQEAVKAFKTVPADQLVEVQFTFTLQPSAGAQQGSTSQEGQMTVLFKLDTLMRLHSEICAASLPRLTPRDQGRARTVCT